MRTLAGVGVTVTEPPVGDGVDGLDDEPQASSAIEEAERVETAKSKGRQGLFMMTRAAPRGVVSKKLRRRGCAAPSVRPVRDAAERATLGFSTMTAANRGKGGPMYVACKQCGGLFNVGALSDDGVVDCIHCGTPISRRRASEAPSLLERRYGDRAEFKALLAVQQAVLDKRDKHGPFAADAVDADAYDLDSPPASSEQGDAR